MAINAAELLRNIKKAKKRRSFPDYILPCTPCTWIKMKSNKKIWVTHMLQWPRNRATGVPRLEVTCSSRTNNNFCAFLRRENIRQYFSPARAFSERATKNRRLNRFTYTKCLCSARKTYEVGHICLMGPYDHNQSPYKHVGSNKGTSKTTALNISVVSEHARSIPARVTQ